MKDSVGAGRALPLPIDHADVQCVVAEGLQPRQHAVGLAALESEDLFLNVASVSFWWILVRPVVNLKQQEQKSGMYKEANKIKVLWAFPQKIPIIGTFWKITGKTEKYWFWGMRVRSPQILRKVKLRIADEAGLSYFVGGI